MPHWDLYDPQLRQWTVEGVKPDEIAKRLNLKRQTVRDRLIKLGLFAPQPKTKASPAQEPTRPEETVEVLPGQVRIEDADTSAPLVSMSTAINIVPVSEVSEPLSLAETQTLEHYEAIITQGFKTFVEVGQALLAIREQRLYRQDYATFEDYLQQRWDLGQSRAYQLMDAAGVVTNLQSSTIVELPSNEAQARPLTTLPPEQQIKMWREAVETAPAGKVTAKHVQETVKRTKATGTTPPKASTPKSLKLFDVQSTTTKIKDLYMDWLKHCETDDALETAQFFLNTLSDLAQGRGMQLHPSR